MVGRKPSLLPRRKKKPVTKPKKDVVGKPETLSEQPDEEILDAPARPAPPKRVKKKKKPRVKRGVKPSAPQEQLSTEDKRVMRRRRQRRRLITRIAILAVVIALVAVVCLNWSALAPDKVWAWFQDWIGGGTGSYPVDLSGTGARRVDQVENYTVVLTESHLTYLNASGAEVARYGCAYSDALVRTEGKYVLVAEQSGCRLHLSTRSDLLKEWETKHTIRAVSLNALGQTAVLTDGPQGYAVQICVYDEEGELLYTRNSNRNALDVALSPDGTTVSLTSVEAVDGTLNTRLEAFSLTASSADAQSTYVAADVLLYRTEYLSGGMLAAVHEQGLVLMDVKNGKTTTYVPAGMHVLGYAVSGDAVALALRPYGDTAGGEVEVLSSSGTVSCSVMFEGEFRHLSGCDGQYTLLTDHYVQLLSLSGDKGKASVSSDGQQAIPAEGKAVVMGRNELNVYTVK